MRSGVEYNRRTALLGSAATLIIVPFGRDACASAGPIPNLQVAAEDFGAQSQSAADQTARIQAAIDAVERQGGGTVVIRGSYRCGNLRLSGHNVRLLGDKGRLINGRVTVLPGASRIEVADLTILNTTQDPRSFSLDVAGQNCRFSNVQLIKQPATGGYQMYVRPAAVNCRFDGLRLSGSNGVFLAGTGHSFQNFDFRSTLKQGVGGDDAFAIKAPGTTTRDITIRRGTVRGFAAIVSFGSEIGTNTSDGHAGVVRNVIVEDVFADCCTDVVFFKPGALIYDWHAGLIENISIRNLMLQDATGRRFRSGIRMMAGRGANIRNVKISSIHIVARAKDAGVAPTAAVDITLLDLGAPAAMSNIDLEVSFTDPYSGEPHSSKAPGYPVDHIVRVEKSNPLIGNLSDIVLKVDAVGSSFGGIVIGAGLDGAITVARAAMRRIATAPRSALGSAGIWSDSTIALGTISVSTIAAPKFGGRAFQGVR
jgi:hypothetical protein